MEKKEEKILSSDQLAELYDCVFSRVHSEGFKSAEMKDLLYGKDYHFLERPKENWLQSITQKLIEMGFNVNSFQFLTHLNK